MHLRLSNDDLSVALVQKPSGKKDGKKHLYNWNDAEIKTISEAAESTQAMMLDQISSDECPTPITKRKEDNYDLQDLTSSSKKQCIKIIKQEKNKND
ncbi:hypothetical protein YC2023_047176 [Brassica napus]